MAFFKRRSPVRQDIHPSATARDEASQQYADPGTAQQQYQRTDRPQQNADRPQQYEDRGPGPQYSDAGRTPQYEPAGRGSRAAETPRGATQEPHGLPGGWLGEIVLGLATLVIGLIVASHPTHSLNVLAILIGVLMIVSGVYHVVRSLRGTGDHRMWGGIAGVLFFLVGIFLIRHVSLTLALIALFAGFAFVIAGIASLAEAVSGHGSMGRAWSAFFGVICIFAGIAAIVTPIHSLTRLAIVLGWAFVAMGIMHIAGAFVSRRALREESRSEQISVPGQRATEPADVQGAYGPSAETQAGAAADAPRHRRSRL